MLPVATAQNLVQSDCCRSLIMKQLSSEECYAQLQQTKKGREYCELVHQIQAENRSPRKYNDGFELHHIQPRALGGQVKSKDNLVKVTYFEHCKLHVLLAKAIQCFETLRPVIRMSNQQYRNCSDLERVSLEEIYEWSRLREEAKKLEYSEETRRKISEGNKGKKLSEEIKQKMSELARGKNTWSRGLVWINNGTEMKRVRQEILEEYLSKGWKRGELSPSGEVREKMSKSLKGKNIWSKGRIRIHKGELEQVIKAEDLNRFLQEGWTQGPSDKTRLKISKSSLGKKGTISGRVKIHKGDTVKLVRKEDLESFLQDGWLLGDSEQRVAKRAERLAGRLWVHNGSQERRPLKGNSLPEGWTFGRLSHR